MLKKWHFSILFLVLTCFLHSKSALAQTPRSLLWEPEFEVTLPSENKWEFSFGLANRYLFYTELDGERLSENEQQHFEVNQFTSYKTSSNAAVALGFRYRFREVFEDSRHDELRIIEQLSYKHRGAFLSPAHRIRFEQRLRELTIYRLRYRIGISQPINEHFDVGLSTEFLYSMVKDLRPETDQRLTFKIENSSFKNLDLGAGLEVRREDYTRAPSSEFYILTEVSLQL